MFDKTSLTKMPIPTLSTTKNIKVYVCSAGQLLMTATTNTSVIRLDMSLPILIKF